MEKKLKVEKYGMRSHQGRFGTEEQCRQFLIDKKWDGRPTCHHCNNQHMNYFITTREVWKCSSCRKQFSIKKNTMFEGSNLPLTVWFKALYYFSTFKRGLSSCQLAKLLEIEQSTAWLLLHKIRAVLDFKKDTILSGLVMVDETYVGANPSRDNRVKRAKKKHEDEQDEKHGLSAKRKTRIRKQLAKEPDAEKRLAEFNAKQAELSKNGEREPFNPSTAILGLYQASGDVLLFHLGRQYIDTRKGTIAPYLLNHISRSSILVTDESHFYTEVGSKFLSHRIVNHDLCYVGKDGTTTNPIENVFLHLKKVIANTYFHISFWNCARYLDEHAFRWNIRGVSERKKVDLFLENLKGIPLRYKELIAPKTAA